MATNSISDFSALNNSLAAGGFNEALNIEASTGNITIAATDHVRAHNLTITADGANPDGTANGGSITLDGAIDVYYAGQGGTVGLYAKKDLTIDATGLIDAQGTGANASGGDVILSVDAGTLTLAGGTIDVSGAGAGPGGTVTFRGPPPPAGGTAMSLSGTVKGASSVVAEIDKVYVNQFQTIDSTAIDQIQGDLGGMDWSDGFGSKLSKGLTDGNGNALIPYNDLSKTGTFHLRPGVVVEQTAGDITLDGYYGYWDLSGWRYGSGNEPGTLTLRAAGNLTINGSLTDSPTFDSPTYGMYDYGFLVSTTAQPSWGFNLVAGAKTGSPDLMAVTRAPSPANATLTISPYQVVYTESGAVRFASAGETVINGGAQNPYMIFPGMNYSLGTYSGSIRGNVGGSLTINAGGAIQSATGSIDIRVGGNLDLVKDYAPSLGSNSLGSIRTTGEQSLVGYDPVTGNAYASNYSGYGGGGSITLDVGGSVNGDLNPDAWLTMNPDLTVTPVYNYTSTEGIAAMAGGSVYVRAGGSFNAQIGAFGQGDLLVYSGGDMTGRFLVKKGSGVLSAMGNFGMPTQLFQGKIQNMPQLIEMADARVSVSAQGNIELGAALNPNLAADAAQTYWDNGYTPTSSLTLTAATGDVNMYGAVDSMRYGTFYTTTGSTRNTYLPPSVEISAGRDIAVEQGFIQLPSATGTLSMAAGKDIVFSQGATWLMSDADPAQVYVPLVYGENVNSSNTVLSSHAAVPVHTNDQLPAVSLTAGRDISDANMNLPKMAVIKAGRDITDLTYAGQNLAAGDMTMIAASGDIAFGYLNNAEGEAVQVGGPGYIVVQAGGRIDLGYSNGIQAVGNTANQGLSRAGGSLVVAAGFAGGLTPQGV